MPADPGANLGLSFITPDQPTPSERGRQALVQLIDGHGSTTRHLPASAQASMDQIECHCYGESALQSAVLRTPKANATDALFLTGWLRGEVVTEHVGRPVRLTHLATGTELNKPWLDIKHRRAVNRIKPLNVKV